MSHEETRVPDASCEPWQLPLLIGMGWRGLDEDQLREAARQTGLEASLDPAPRLEE